MIESLAGSLEGPKAAVEQHSKGAQGQTDSRFQRMYPVAKPESDRSQSSRCTSGGGHLLSTGSRRNVSGQRLTSQRCHRVAGPQPAGQPPVQSAGVNPAQSTQTLGSADIKHRLERTSAGPQSLQQAAGRYHSAGD